MTRKPPSFVGGEVHQQQSLRLGGELGNRLVIVDGLLAVAELALEEGSLERTGNVPA